MRRTLKGCVESMVFVAWRLSWLCAGGAHVNSYGARVGSIVGVIGSRERPRLSADSTAI